MKASTLLTKLFGAALSITILANAGNLPVTLPAAAASLQMPITQATYIVRAGDTLSAIAQRYGTTVNDLLTMNGLHSTTIYVGQRLIVPGAQTPLPSAQERIQFAKGATAATLQGILRGSEQKQYILRAMAGQVMAINVAAHDASVQLAVQGVSDGVTYKLLAERYDGDSSRWVGTLPATQDYVLTVATGISTGPRVAYQLTVSITTPATPAHPGRPERIQFARGAISATVYGTVDNRHTKRYILGARRGQQMWLSGGPDTHFIVYAPNGAVLNPSDGPMLNWSGILPANGDYQIEVVSMTRVAHYTLDVTIR